MDGEEDGDEECSFDWTSSTTSFTSYKCGGTVAPSFSPRDASQTASDIAHVLSSSSVPYPHKNEFVERAADSGCAITSASARAIVVDHETVVCAVNGGLNVLYDAELAFSLQRDEEDKIGGIDDKNSVIETDEAMARRLAREFETEDGHADIPHRSGSVHNTLQRELVDLIGVDADSSHVQALLDDDGIVTRRMRSNGRVA